MLWIIMASYIGMGALLMAAAQPLIARKVEPNDVYGVRTPKTKSSPDIWYKANEYGGRVICAVGALVAASAILLLPVARWGLNAYALTCAAVLVLGCLWMVVLNLKYIAKL